MLVIGVKAQNICGFEHYEMITKNPLYENTYQDLEKKIKSYSQNPKLNSLQSDVINVPIVFHVINLGEPVGTGSNIPTTEILSALQDVNNLYKGTNGYGVDMQVNFCLASQDPNGNPSTGINRVDGSSIAGYKTYGFTADWMTPGSCEDNHILIKDLSKWPSDQYLNIWIIHKYCLPAGTLVGRAEIVNPGGSAAYNGVSILASEISKGTITLAHEIAHMIGLFKHSFGSPSSNCADPETSCIDQGDNICDTPPHRQTDWGPTNPCSAIGIWDNSRYNIMSYSWVIGPTAQFNKTTVRFTADQKDRVRSTIYAVYPGFFSSKGCTPPSNNDAGIQKIVYPINSTYTNNCTFSNNLSPVVELKNYGLNTLTSVNIKYKIDNDAIRTYNWTGNLLKDSSVMVTLPSGALSQGEHTFLAYTTKPNAETDEYFLNDSADVSMTYLLNQNSEITLSTSYNNPSCSTANDGSATVVASSTNASKFEIIENFEGTSDWIISNGSELNYWKIGNATANGGTKSIYITNNNISNAYSTNITSAVNFYKDFYFPTGATNIKIKFDWKSQGEVGADKLDIYLMSTDAYQLAHYVNFRYPNNTIASPLGTYYSQANFKTDSIIGLDGNAGTAKRIVFSWINDNANGTQSPAAIDNITISYNLPSSQPSYTYAWSNSQITPTITDLQVGTYSVVVTDNNNCTSIASVVLSQATPCGSGTGVNENSDKKTISIYPNPVSDKLSIESDDLIHTIKMFDVTGQLILNGQINNVQTKNQNSGLYQTSVDVSNCAKGIYVLQVYTDSGILIRKVSIK